MVTIAILAGVAFVASAVPASAGDLEEYLREAEEADYSGRQIVVSMWDGEPTMDILTIEHTGSMLMLEDGNRGSLVGSGRVSAVSQGAGSVMIAGWTTVGYASRYSTGEPVAVRRLGRDAKSVSIMEDDTLRARIIFDLATGAPLRTEVYLGDGTTLFRFSSMIEFDPLPRRLYRVTGLDSGAYDVMPTAPATGLPPEIAGYRLADSYSGPGDGVQSFYSDGLFGFSVFEFEGSLHDVFDHARTMEVDGSKYRVLVAPSQLWVHWRTPNHSYLLLGDLPRDHLEQVLTGLPRPGSRGFLSRMWRGIFG